MSVTRVFGARLRGLFGGERLERELNDEIRFHLDRQIEDNIEAGMNPEDARHAARRSFGALESMKEQYRERRAIPFLESLGQDVRYAVRTLGRNTSFTAASITTLALAIGAGAAMFSVVNAVLLRPFPYRSTERLAMLWTDIPSQSVRQGRSAYWNVEQWRREATSFEDMAMFDGVSMTLTTNDGADRISVARISPNFFDVLGIQPVRGRMFSPAESEQRLRVALISHRFWQARFGGSDGALGASIELNNRPSQIIGILPASLQFPKLDADVWEPQTLFPDWEARRKVRGSDTWSVIGRLHPSVTWARVQEEMTAIARRLDEQLPMADRNRGVTVVPFTQHVVGPRPRLALWLLSAFVGCVLLIAASNVASLSIARSMSRVREIAVRVALGASAARIFRQLLVESVTLAFLSGVVGSLFAFAAVGLIRASKPVELSRLNEITVDLRVLGCALGLSLVVGILVGLAPATAMWGRSLRPAIEDGGRTMSAGVVTRVTHKALIVSEFALAIVLLVGAGLLIRSWRFIENIHPGFSPERVLSMDLRTPVAMPQAQRTGFYNRLLEAIQVIPGVESAGFASDVFISSTSEQVLMLEGGVASIPDRLQFRRDEVSPDFFRALRTPLLSGRFFSREDRPDSPRVAIVNQALARRVWPAMDPIGRRFKIGPADSGSNWFTVVGVIADMRRQGLEEEPVPQIFECIAQSPPGGGSLLIRTTFDDPLEIAGTIEQAVRRVEKLAPVYGVTTLDNRLGAFLTARRFQTSLAIAFAAIALAMAAVGIYGLLQYSVSTRTQEIGVRMAVGAKASDIFGLVIAGALKLSFAGLLVGLLGALWIGQIGSSLLFGVQPTDPLTFIAVSLLLTMVAIVACYLPARRAMKVEPVVALRHA